MSRSAKEAEEKIKKALDKGEVLPTEARFDSNCITPGKDAHNLDTGIKPQIKNYKGTVAEYLKIAV